MNWKFWLFVIIILAFILAAMFEKHAPGDRENNIRNETIGGEAVLQPECITDRDCFPAACCHADSCLPSTQKPDCSETYCTLECQPGTLDCGQGSCQCINGKCQAVIEHPLP
ncbi:hypothetical protein HYS48_03150 [Candidatus Woesearchaeota archaeon]|nr:hypothetical protein [Candidatus Woesearchaeota archaeon]